MSQGQDIFGITYKKGEVIFRQGELGNTMYIIQSGAVEISQIQKEKKVVLALLENGDFFGEMALIDSHPRSATATAITLTRLLPFTRTSLIERIQDDPGVVIHLLKTLCHRITKTNQLVIKIVQGNERLRFSVENQRQKISKLDMSFKKIESSKNDSDIYRSVIDGPVNNLFSSKTIDFFVDPKECLKVEPNEFIFRQGDIGNSMFIILEGKVEISQDSDLDKYILAFLGPGDFFGETAIITDQPRSANAMATMQTLLLQIKKADFKESIQIEPKLALYILKGLILRLRLMLSVISSPEKSLNILVHSLSPPLKKDGKIRTAIISLSTCGGCSAIILEDIKKLSRLIEKIDVVYCPMLMDEKEIGDVEIAIVDGSLRVKEDVDKLLEARRRSHYLIAWGTCASFGGIPAFANQHELEELINESYGQAKDPFAYYLSGIRGIELSTFQEKELKLLRKAGKLDDHVKVDYYVPGCPPNVNLLIQLISELKGEGEIFKPEPIVCSECNRKPLKTTIDHFWVLPRPTWEVNHCFTALGSICMGFVTKGGCGAICPQGGLPCWGCRGPSETAFKKIEEGNSFEEFMLNSLTSRHKHMEKQIKLVMKIFRKSACSSLKFIPYSANYLSRLR